MLGRIGPGLLIAYALILVLAVALVYVIVSDGTDEPEVIVQQQQPAGPAVNDADRTRIEWERCKRLANQGRDRRLGDWELASLCGSPQTR